MKLSEHTLHLSKLYLTQWPCKHINAESTLKQRWLSMSINVDIWLQVKVEPTYICRRCFNVDKQRWNNVYRITSIQYQSTNVASTLIFGWKWKLSQGLFIGVASTSRKQHWNNFINCCTDVHKKVDHKQNKIKFSNIKHIFLLYKNIAKSLFYL